MGNAVVSAARSGNNGSSEARQKQQNTQKQAATPIDPDTGKFSPVSTFGDELADRVLKQRLTREPQSYTVQAGDSLSEISEALYGDAYLFTEIAAANGITDPNYGIQAGQELVIPGLGLVTDGYRSQLNQIGRSEIGRLGNEALTAIDNFDFSRLYNNDFSINDSAVLELTNYHRRAALDANILFDGSRVSENGYRVDIKRIGLNGREVFYSETRERLPVPPPSLNDIVQQIALTTKDIVGNIGTITGISGDISAPIISTRLLDRSKVVGGSIAAGPNGKLNAYQRGLLANANTLSDATAVFSNGSKSGQAIRSIASSPALHVAKKLPAIGNFIGALTIPAAFYGAEPGNEYRDTVAASASFGGGVGIPLLVGAGVALIASAPIAIAAGVATAIGYGFFGGSDLVEDTTKDIFDFVTDNHNPSRRRR